jgi:hypothetical protein
MALAYFSPLMLLVYRVVLVAVGKNLEPSLVNLIKRISGPTTGIHVN